MSTFKIGQTVYWNDPDDQTNDEYVIAKINGDVYLLVNEWGETEAYKNELEMVTR